MYCVIQEVRHKKPNRNGDYKKLRVCETKVNGITKYGYEFSGGRFERPIKTAYKISVHESKRVNGVVIKNQYVVTTLSYYDLIDIYLTDYFKGDKLNEIAAKLDTKAEYIEKLILEKIRPIQNNALEAFYKTEEGVTRNKHNRILRCYQEAKLTFAALYLCASDDYDFCYDVFGNLMNESYLEQVINTYKSKGGFQRESYSGFDWDKFTKDIGNLNFKISNYTDNEKAMLKKFFRTLAKIYHPDANLDTDTTDEMAFLYRLKDSWGI